MEPSTNLSIAYFTLAIGMFLFALSRQIKQTGKEIVSAIARARCRRHD